MYLTASSLNVLRMTFECNSGYVGSDDAAILSLLFCRSVSTARSCCYLMLSSVR